jgi:VWFA-related protein
LIIATLLALPAGLAQQEDPRQRIRTTVALVVVPVTAKDSAGTAVLDIRRDEFRILEDGVEQEIQVFSNDPFPLSAVVLVDNGLPLKTAEEVQRSLRAVAGAFSEFDEVALGLYDLFYQPVLDFTTDNDRLYDHLKRLELTGKGPGLGSAPMTSPPRVDTSRTEPRVPTPGLRAARLDRNLDDAIYAAAELLRTRSRDRRKVIFLVSDGGNSRNNTHSHDDALKALLSSDISVYAIGVGIATANRPLNPLAKYARATGGDVFYATSRGEIERLYSNVAEQARNQYTLAYSPAGTNRTLDYHSIEVRVRRTNLTLYAREGYYTPVVP